MTKAIYKGKHLFWLMALEAIKTGKWQAWWLNSKLRAHTWICKHTANQKEN